MIPSILSVEAGRIHVAPGFADLLVIRRLGGLLAAIAIAPKILFVGVRSLNAPLGLSFPIEPRNLATSSSLWAWCILLAAFGVFLMFLPQRLPQAPDAPVQPRPRRSLLIAALGLVPIAVAVVMLLGLTEGFHRIDDAGQGRWALRHAARGNVAIFTGNLGVRWYGRSFSVTTKSAAALEELRKFATTANLPKGKVRIVRRNGGRWTSGASGFTLKDCVGRRPWPIPKAGTSGFCGTSRSATAADGPPLLSFPATSGAPAGASCAAGRTVEWRRTVAGEAVRAPVLVAPPRFDSSRPCHSGSARRQNVNCCRTSNSIGRR